MRVLSRHEVRNIVGGWDSTDNPTAPDYGYENLSVDKQNIKTCVDSIKSEGAVGFGIGAVFGALGGVPGAIIVGLVGALVGGADAIKSTPECKVPEPPKDKKTS